jgi:DNA polymerase elongation subunit (family B)
MSTPRREVLFFDLETEKNLASLELMPEPKASKALKDPAKIAADIAEKRLELIESAALDPDYGKIASIGYATEIDGPISVIMVGDAYWAEPGFDGEGNRIIIDQCYTERDLLNGFWRKFADCNGRCCGYNILGFDLIYLLRRSMALCVKVPFSPALAKFRTEPVTDLMMILYNWEFGKWKGLKQVARLYGLDNPLPDLDGSMFAQMTPVERREYQANDVYLVQQLAQRMNGVYFNL